MPTGGAAVDETGMRLKPSSSSRRSVSGPAPISIGPIVVDTTSHHARNASNNRDITLLENGMVVEQIDVRKEERERRREEKRERSRNRKTSRGSGGDRNGEVVSMYSAHSPVPYQTDSGFYTSASNGSAAMLARENRPMSVSGSSMRAMSMLTANQPLTPPPGSASYAGSTRQPNTRVQSQVSLLDSQSISSASLNANRRSRFFAFRNWSEAWKSRESFAPSGVLSMNGSMMDMQYVFTHVSSLQYQLIEIFFQSRIGPGERNCAYASAYNGFGQPIAANDSTSWRHLPQACLSISRQERRRDGP